MSPFLKLSELVARNLFKGLLFTLLIIALFNLLSDFAVKLGQVNTVLNASQQQYFIVLALLLESLNVLFEEFPGIKNENVQAKSAC